MTEEIRSESEGRQAKVRMKGHILIVRGRPQQVPSNGIGHSILYSVHIILGRPQQYFSSMTTDTLRVKSSRSAMSCCHLALV